MYQYIAIASIAEIKGILGVLCLHMVSWIFCMLQMYADCLAQAIYAAFCGAFPQSKERFNDDFKKVLAEVICLWVSGKCILRCKECTLTLLELQLTSNLFLQCAVHMNSYESMKLLKIIHNKVLFKIKLHNIACHV